jgi:hypothetical protein
MTDVINSLMKIEGPHVNSVILHEDGSTEERLLDMTPRINTLGKLVNGRVSFIGQWDDIQVVLVRCFDQTRGKKNKHVLPKPFCDEITYGPIVLVRMDENAEPQDFTLDEYLSMCE